MIAIFAIISLSSCTKNQSLDQTSVDLADDDAVSDAVYEDIFSSVDNAEIILTGFQKGDESKSGMAVLADSCPLITITNPGNSLWPKTITIDYGTGCSGYYESTRAGKIIIQVSGPRMTKGSKKTVSFSNYVINGIKVEGTKVIENLGYNNNQNMEFSVKLTGGKLTLPDGKTIQRTVEHKREITAGLLTRTIWDDECLITGTASGVTINGKSHVNTITTALKWKRVCKFIVSGVVKIEREGAEPVEINYGSGECDALATVKRGGESKEITLRYRHRLQGSN
jgi:hypothetical protein